MSKQKFEVGDKVYLQYPNEEDRALGWGDYLDEFVFPEVCKPYIIKQFLGNTVVELNEHDGKMVPWSIHTKWLKKYEEFSVGDEVLVKLPLRYMRLIEGFMQLEDYQNCRDILHNKKVKIEYVYSPDFYKVNLINNHDVTINNHDGALIGNRYLYRIDDNSGYRITSDGFKTNDKNWDKWLL